MFDPEFQFLIGTLKTLFSFSGATAVDWEFQFLIGTLKTENSREINGSLTLVSIPYRYSKNFLREPEVVEHAAVSIPYRYSKNPEQNPALWEDLQLFQFLIGTLKTRQELCYVFS